MAAALGVVVVILALCGLASASPPRASQRSESFGRSQNPDALQNEINDLILPLLSPPRGKSASSKPQLQLTDLLSDASKSRNNQYVQLATFGKSADGKTRDKNPVAIFVADLPRSSADQRSNDHTEGSEEDGDTSRDSDNEDLDESAGQAKEGNPDQSEQHVEALTEEAHEGAHEEAHKEEHEDRAVERHDASSEVGPVQDKEPVDGGAEVKPEQQTEDPTLDESLSTLQLLSQDIASALRAEQAAEPSEDGRVMECVEHKDSVAPETRPVTQEREALEEQLPAEYWKHYLAEARAREGNVAWVPKHSHVDPQKAYHLSFSFTK